MRFDAGWGVAALRGASALGTIAMMGAAAAAPAERAAEKAELPLHYGVNEVKAGEARFQILRGFVNHQSGSFDTYTVFLQPAKADAPWMHISVPAAKGVGYHLRSAETADATLVAVAFFRQQNELYAVEAERDGATPAERQKKAAVQFRVYKFNGNPDTPMFEAIETRQALVRYQNADDALKDEFFIAAGGRYRPAR